MSGPDIPSNYTINSTSSLSGALDLDLDNIRIKEIPQITLNSQSSLTSDSKVDLGLNDIRIKEMPRIAFNPTRIHSPVNLRFGVCTLGFELLAFTVCGESMVIIEDYQPHDTEVCA